MRFRTAGEMDVGPNAEAYQKQCRLLLRCEGCCFIFDRRCFLFYVGVENALIALSSRCLMPLSPTERWIHRCRPL